MEVAERNREPPPPQATKSCQYPLLEYEQANRRAYDERGEATDRLSSICASQGRLMGFRPDLQEPRSGHWKFTLNLEDFGDETYLVVQRDELEGAVGKRKSKPSKRFPRLLLYFDTSHGHCLINA
ncbi:hypothetical protein RB213_005232 [Colletotrichum asianum]